ncbi:cell division protein ZipA-like isoform X2 [Dreissena polymorpha]|uniref:cell division protein ZipA-like isoform X2 n=1 Tax=Dreissena polymorpha TaxID=45954 RepID=UPI002263EC69|nr:cell division protein ZipA-like isoform X2 [Dreissena polymorpha]
METRNRKRRRPSVKLHQHPSQNLPGTSQQPRQLPSTQMPDQLPPNQQPVQLPLNQQPVQLPLTPSHRLGQCSSNQQSGHQPDQLPLSQQLGDQMQPAASQPDPAVQSGYVISSLATPVPWEEGLSGVCHPDLVQA